MSEALDPTAVATSAPPPEGPFTLAIDIGGTGIKCMLLDSGGNASGKRNRIETPRPATPEAVLAVIKSLLPDMPFERVSVGFPGVVISGITHSAPNLDKAWRGYNLQQALESLIGRPTRVLNDAGLQGLGVISGQGSEIVLTLGTGMGCALFVRGRYVPNVELAHHPFKKGKTYEQWVGSRALERVGKKKWNKRVADVLAQVQPFFNPHVIYLGGGNAKHLAIELPPNVRKTENIAGLLGGIALWR